MGRALKHAAVILTAALALVGCVRQVSPFASGGEREPQAAEALFLEQHPALASRDGKRLTLRFADGRRIVRADRGQDECEHPPSAQTADCYASYRVVGYRADRDIFLLDILAYEGGAAALIASDGTEILLPGRPVFSRDGTRFAAYGDDCVHFGGTGIEIWNWPDRLPVQAFSDTVEACIRHADWTSSRKLVMELSDEYRDLPDRKPVVWQTSITQQTNGRWAWTHKSAPETQQTE